MTDGSSMRRRLLGGPDVTSCGRPGGSGTTSTARPIPTWPPGSLSTQGLPRLRLGTGARWQCVQPLSY